MRSLVFGGNGFIGVHLVERLLDSGHAVRVYDRGPNKFRALPRGAEYVEGDLGNHGLIRAALEDVEVVYHFVSTTLPKTSNDDPIYDVRSNLVDTLQLLESCVEARVRKVVFASSGGTAYGVPQVVPISEEHPTNPITSYGIVKLAIEKYLGLFSHLHGLDYTALRISNPYGAYQNPVGQQGAVTVFLDRIHKGETIPIWGDGGVVRDYLYVADLVDALEAVAETETRRKVLNIGSGQGTSLNELLALMADVTGETPAVDYQPGRPLDAPSNVLDISRAREELGWSPSTSLEDGVARTWDWVRSLADDPIKREP